MEGENKRKRRESAENKWTDEFSRKLIESSPIGIYIVQDGVFKLVSPEFQRITGYSEQEVLGRNALDLVHPEDRKMVREAAIAMLKKRFFPYEFRIVTRNGKIKWILETVTSIQYEDRRAALGNFLDVTERRQAKTRVRESTNFLGTIVSSSHDAIVTMDNEGNISFWNKAAERMFGYAKAEVSGKELHRLLAPRRFHQAHMESFRLFQESGRGQAIGRTLELVGVKKDGSEFPIELSLSAMKLKEQWHAIGIIRDISERKKAEEALRESEEKFRITFDSAPDSITISKMDDGRYLFVNDAFCNFTGYSKEEAIGKTPFEMGLYANPADRERLIAGLQQKGMVERFELQYRMKDGRVLDALLSGRILRYGKEDCLVAIVKDITEFKRTQAQLRESEKRYRDLFDSVSDFIYTQDLEGRYTNANRAMTSIFGYELEEFIGRKAADFMKPEVGELFHTEYLEGIKKKGHYEGVSSFFTKDGRKIYLEYRNNLIRPEGGEPFISGIARDVTERILAEREIKRLNKQMLQAQKMEAVGTLAGGIAHDFNNLLQAILGYTQILIMPKDESDPDIADLRQIEKAAKRAGELTQQLLGFSRKVESKPRPLNLNQEVQQVEKLLKRTIPKMIDIELHLEEGLQTINADPAQLEQVMMNLGVNARDAMEEGGKLLLETENVVLDEGYCRDHLGARPGRYVLLSISDTGKGMDKKTLDHIFDPFFTTKEVGKGTGLGLATVYGIVKSHKGYIMCYSEPGQGTTFKIYLPVMEEETKERKVAKKQQAMPEGGDETILLVDDEELLRGIGRDILEQFGYTVILANDGESALEVYEKRAKDISLVILDLMMPGMGGKRCLVELLKINPDVKVVIASGYSINCHARDALEAGAKAFVSKPFELKQILGVVREVLDHE
ncbi:MAG: PAS domain S-box protein [Deltaproteobacteria bacterium]|nr:PAS domain S-box protein [Deltaproteobacteria bacterium]